jgi:hypothetical protein
MEILGVAIAASKLVNSVGLALDIAGALLLFKFGLPEEISRSGHGALLVEQVDEAEVARRSAMTDSESSASSCCFWVSRSSWLATSCRGTIHSRV